MKKITIGARGSKLSLAYVKKVKNLILEKSKDIIILTREINDINNNIEYYFKVEDEDFDPNSYKVEYSKKKKKGKPKKKDKPKKQVEPKMKVESKEEKLDKPEEEKSQKIVKNSQKFVKKRKRSQKFAKQR